MIKLQTMPRPAGQGGAGQAVDYDKALEQYKKIISMCKTAKGIINGLHSPIDSVNRFINLALQTIGEDSPSRQFLIESKQGIRKTSSLLKKVDNYTKKIEKEVRVLSGENE